MQAEKTSNQQYPEVLSLPHPVQRSIAGLLDGDALHNWKTLVAAVPQYSQDDATRFSTEAQLGRSPTMAILADLNSRGWSIVDLAQLAHQARLGIIVDKIRDHCKKKRLSLPLPPPCSLHSARTCYDRPTSPPQPTPPSTPTAVAEALQRYDISPASDQAVLSLTSPTASAPIHVPYQDILKATGQLQGAHRLGQGAAGEVFWCCLHRQVAGLGQRVAVKVLRNKEALPITEVYKQQFIADVQALSMLRHPHLLRVLGYSCDGPQLCMVYPYMSHGSLDRHLSHLHNLTTTRRLQVAVDVSSALQYLHCGLPQLVLHRDVKSANILLTGQWRAVLGDYGVLRFQPTPGTAVTSMVAGTNIYMAPEYKRGGTLSWSIDIFSFGVVLFELALGVCALSSVKQHARDMEGTDLVTFVENYEGVVEDVLVGKWEGVGQQLWVLAEQCIDNDRTRRPAATKLHRALSKLMQKFHTTIRQTGPSPS